MACNSARAVASIVASVGFKVPVSVVACQKSAKFSNVRCTVIVRVSIASSPASVPPAPVHNVRSAARLVALPLGGAGGAMPMVRNAALIGAVGLPPPGWSHT